MRLAIIANPVAGRGRAFRALLSYLRDCKPQGWDIENHETRSMHHAGLLARGFLHDPPDLVAVCGGDGTINEVASEIPEPPFPVAIIPGGTANVLAKELGLPLDPIKALQVALRRSVRRVDLGKLGPGARRRFLFVAGIGFDAYVASTVKPGFKAKFGIAAYAARAVRSLIDYHFPEFQVAVAGRVYTATSCLACNAERYGGGMLFAPGANMNDGVFDVVILQSCRRGELAWFLFQAWCRRALKREWVHRLRAQSLTIEGPSEVLVQTDGELAGTIPVTLTLSPSVFPLVVP